MGGTAILLAILLGQGSASLSTASEIELRDRDVRLGDVARVEPPEGGLAGRVIASLPPGRASVTLERVALAGLIRRAAPGVRIADEGEGAVTLRLAPRERAQRRCFALAHPVAVGATIGAADLMEADCRAGESATAIVYDRAAGAPRARHDLAAGQYLGSVAVAPAAGVDRGERLTLASTAGPVRIERTVVALQPARPGARIFVRTGDGEVLVAAVPAGDDR